MKPKFNDFSTQIKSFIQSFFFGNYFYGICVMALSIETTLQLNIPLASIYYYIYIFLFTIVFYTHAYQFIRISGISNPRTNWYIKQRTLVQYSQYLFTIIGLTILLFFIFKEYANLINIPFDTWLLIIIFPIVAVFYYGVDINKNQSIQLRNIGWLKPFTIGFVWAGVVSVYPVLFMLYDHSLSNFPVKLNALLFINNMMFISMLCILFDIKDFATDSNQRIKTLVVKTGLRATIFSFVIPMSLLGLGSYLMYAITNDHSLFRIIFNSTPYILLICISYTLHKPKSILYYLIIIDGLMLVKAICGSIASLF